MTPQPEPAEATPRDTQTRASQWDDAAFIRRVQTLATRKNLTLREVCRRAKLAPDLLNKTPRLSRTVASVYKIAQALDADPAELLGIQVEAALPPDPRLDRLLVVTRVAVLLYLALEQRNAAPDGVDPQQVIKVLLGMIDPA